MSKSSNSSDCSSTNGKNYFLRDFLSKERVEPENFVFAGDDSPWEVVMDLDKIKSTINEDYFRSSPPLVSKYLPLLPIKDFANFVSLKEGSTPLIKSKVIGPELGIDLLFKLESANPTGSFKDRGSAVELTIAKELGVKGITVASTGNMAASCSCYAAAAQLPCFIFVPEDTPASKISQSIAYGGRIVKVKGSYNDAARLAKEVALEMNYYLAGDYAFRVEGHKTAAFELLEQLYFELPEAILVPIGCGTNMTSYAKGYSEYKELGFIDKMPRLIGLQAEGASPLVSAFQDDRKDFDPVVASSTVAGAIGIGNPIDGVKALDAVYSTDGYMAAVSDQEMLEAQYRLSKEEGIFVEASCATSVAHLLKKGSAEQFAGKKVVCVLTGGGLKDPTTILKIAVKPPTIYPEIENFLALHERSIFEGNTVCFVDREQEVFSSTPSPKEVAAKLKEFFQVEYDQIFVERVLAYIKDFLSRGKAISFSDLQDIVQDVLEKPNLAETSAMVKVLDYRVSTGADETASAWVKISHKEKETEAEANGVGPVDALISALQKATPDGANFKLEGFKVLTRSSGTDAVVLTELKISRNGVRSVGAGTSPDIIRASITAFEDAYNASIPKSEEK